MSDTVPGFGPDNAKIMFVGEAPAATEVRFGRPFVGPAGQELDKLLATAHIDRSKCYFTNASLEPVSTLDKDKHFFSRKNVPTETFINGLVQLGHDINRIKPNIVVPLGNYALYALMGHQHILKWRGSVLESPIFGCKVLPTIHPSALLRGKSDYSGKMQGGMYKYRTVVIWDLQKVRNESESRGITRRERTVIIDPKGSDEDEAVYRLLAAESITFDIESWGGTKLACIGFSPNDAGLAYVFSYDGSDRRTNLFRRILESDNPKVGQNLMYDCTMLDQNGIHPTNIEHDTMLAQHVLCPELPRGLDFLCSVYTDMPYYKEEGKVWNMPKTDEVKLQYFTYNGKDVCATTEVAQKQRTELADVGQEHIFRREMAIFEPLRWTTYHGARCDIRLLDELIAENKINLVESRTELRELAGPDFNPNSPKQMAKLLYEDQKLPPRTKGGKLKTDAKTLKDIEARTGDPIVGTILKYRKAQKLDSNYFTRGILSPDGRIRSSYRIDGTRFGRLSSSAPLWGTGLNGQNIPNAARKFMIADDGFELWEFDQAQAEAVIVAYLANDPVHIDCFRYNKDVHRVTACFLLGMDPAEWRTISKGSSARQLAKKCNHAFNYNMQWMTFMAIVNAEHDPDDPDSPKLDPQTAKLIREVYMQNRPALPGYWEQIAHELRANRTLVSPLGREYTFLDQWSDSLLKEAYSFKPQSTVGDSTNIGIVQVYESTDPDLQYLFKNGMRLWGQVHDSAIFQVPVGARDYAMKLMKTMEVPILINGYKVTVPIEGGAGPTWNKKEHDDLGRSRVSVEDEYEPALAS